MSDLWAFKPQAREAPRLVGFDVEALDGSIGVIERTTSGPGSAHLIVDTGFWNLGKKRMIPAGMIDSIDLERRKVVINMTKDQITEAPAFQTMEDQAREQQAESVEEPAAGTATTTDTQSGGTATGFRVASSIATIVKKQLFACRLVCARMFSVITLMPTSIEVLPV